MSRIFKVAPQHIRRVKWIKLSGATVAAVVACSIILTQENNRIAWTYWFNIAMGLIFASLFIFITFRQMLAQIEELTHHGVGLDDDHLILYDKGRETRVPYTAIRKVVFRGHASDIKSISGRRRLV